MEKEDKKVKEPKEKFSINQLTNNEDGKTSAFIVIPIFVLLFTLPLFVYTVVCLKDIPLVQQVVTVILGVLGIFGAGGFVKRKM